MAFQRRDTLRELEVQSVTVTRSNIKLSTGLSKADAMPKRRRQLGKVVVNR
jgi:hypothetical protein